MIVGRTLNSFTGAASLGWIAEICGKRCTIMRPISESSEGKTTSVAVAAIDNPSISSQFS